MAVKSRGPPLGISQGVFGGPSETAGAIHAFARPEMRRVAGHRTAGVCALAAPGAGRFLVCPQAGETDLTEHSTEHSTDDLHRGPRPCRRV